MERFAWKGRIKPGMRDEYKRRHDEIWPEMVALLKSAGIRNYTIWNNGDELIGYYECPDLEAAERYKAASEVMQRWSRSMEGIMEMERSASGEVARYECIFELI